MNIEPLNCLDILHSIFDILFLSAMQFDKLPSVSTVSCSEHFGGSLFACPDALSLVGDQRFHFDLDERIRRT